MIFNRSRDSQYRSQRKTKTRPASACNVTVAAMACMMTGNEINSPEGVMPEDYLMSLLETEEAWNLLNSIFPGSVINPWNTSHCIAWAVNKGTGKRVCRVEKVTLEEIIHHLVSGGAAGVGGKFTKSGHFVCIAGVESDQDITGIESPLDIKTSLIKNIILDDPWGDYRTGYQNRDGNNVSLPVKDFINLTFGKESVKTVQMYYPVAIG